MKLRERLRVTPSRRVRLSRLDAADTGGLRSKAAVRARLAGNVRRMADLQHLLWAENKRALLIVLQAMDAGGKDGTIRHVMAGMNPQGCRVTSFKKPTPEELDHDFLWRIHDAVPARGEVGIFNRSHYEDVLVVRVHDLVPESVWSRRYDQINEFERFLAANGVEILKFFLHISKDEQRKRLRRRLRDPSRHWKLSRADFEERKFWNDYQRAYEVALSRCSTAWAPWYVIPADRKWFRDFAVSQIIVETLESLEMEFPKPSVDVSRLRLE